MKTLLLGIWFLPLILLVLGGIIFMFLAHDEAECHCTHCGDPISPLSHGLCDPCLEKLATHQPPPTTVSSCNSCNP